MVARGIANSEIKTIEELYFFINVAQERADANYAAEIPSDQFKDILKQEVVMQKELTGLGSPLQVPLIWLIVRRNRHELLAVLLEKFKENPVDLWPKKGSSGNDVNGVYVSATWALKKDWPSIGAVLVLLKNDKTRSELFKKAQEASWSWEKSKEPGKDNMYPLLYVLVQACLFYKNQEDKKPWLEAIGICVLHGLLTDDLKKLLADDFKMQIIQKGSSVVVEPVAESSVQQALCLLRLRLLALARRVGLNS